MPILSMNPILLQQMLDVILKEFFRHVQKGQHNQGCRPEIASWAVEEKKDNIPSFL